MIYLRSLRNGARRTVYLFKNKTAKDVLGRMEFAGRPAYTADMMADPLKAGGEKLLLTLLIENSFI